MLAATHRSRLNEGQLVGHAGKQNPTTLQQPPPPASLASSAPLPLPRGTTGIAAAQWHVGTPWLTPCWLFGAILPSL